MTLIEVLTASFLFAMMIVYIGFIYSDSIKSYKRADFEQIAQKSAGIIIETISREIRSAVRIEGPCTTASSPYNVLISFPIDKNQFPLWNEPGYTGSVTPPARGTSPYVCFTNDATPVKQENIFYHFRKDECAIFYYTRIKKDDYDISYLQPRPDSDLIHMNKPDSDGSRILRKFSSDGRIIIENFEVWSAPDGVVLRVQLTDRSFIGDPVTPNYDYKTETKAPGGENIFDKRPLVTQSIFIAIRYYQ